MEHATLALPAGPVVLRDARSHDLRRIVHLLADDQVGRNREEPDGDVAPYERALEEIDADPAHLLLVADYHGQLAGTFQLSFIPGLARQGACRAQIEALRVAPILRSQGLGQAMLEWAIAESRRRGCALVQLTSDKQRSEAHRFYRRLGFEASHEGMKLALAPDG